MEKMSGNLVMWHGMMRDINKYVRSCHLCQASKQKPCKFIGPLQAVIPIGPREIVALDILGPLVRSTYGYTCVLGMVDLFSKYTKLYWLRKATSGACLRRIHQYVKECGRPIRSTSVLQQEVERRSNRIRDKTEKHSCQKYYRNTIRAEVPDGH